MEQLRDPAFFRPSWVSFTGLHCDAYIAEMREDCLDIIEISRERQDRPHEYHEVCRVTPVRTT